MKTERKRKAAIWLPVCVAILLCSIFIWEYCRTGTPEEMALRQQVVSTAEKYLGYNEQDLSQQEIVDLYNSHSPQARGYQVTYEDSWCAVFTSAVSIECGLTDILPTECSCQEKIKLFQALGRWEERDTYIPQSGDIIFYAWDDPKHLGNCTCWADHVGIVMDTFGPVLKVIEGNWSDAVCIRYLLCTEVGIRGYGLPDYAAAAQ